MLGWFQQEIKCYDTLYVKGWAQNHGNVERNFSIVRIG